MKTRTIIYLARELEALVHTLNDYIPAYKHEEILEYYRRATNVFGFIVHESVFNWVIRREFNYDRKVVRENVTEFQWAMFTSIEKKYLNIILKNDVKFQKSFNLRPEQISMN